MHQTVAPQPRLPGKGFGDDQQAVVPAAAAGAGVAGAGVARMAGRIVDQLNLLRTQRGESLADEPGDAGSIAADECVAAHAGSTLRKGLTVTPA